MSTKTLLIIDDDEVDLMASKRHLRSCAEDFDIETANTIEGGLKLIRSSNPAAIICDHHLGIANSLDFLEQLRRRGLTIPVIVLTGRGDETIAVEALKAGAADYLRKDNLDPTRFEHTIRSVIASAEQRQFAERARLALHALASGTANHTGESFFTALVTHLGPALQARAAWVQISNSDNAEVIAGWRQPGEDLHKTSYPLAGSPCVDALMSEQVHHCANTMMTLTGPQGIATIAGHYHGIALRDSLDRPFGCLVLITEQADSDLLDSLLRIFGERTAGEWNRLRLHQNQQEEHHRQRAIAQCAQALFLNLQPTRTLAQCCQTASHELAGISIQLWQRQDLNSFLIAESQSSNYAGEHSVQISSELERLLNQQMVDDYNGGLIIPLVASGSTIGWLQIADSSVSLRDRSCLQEIADLMAHYLAVQLLAK